MVAEAAKSFAGETIRSGWQVDDDFRHLSPEKARMFSEGSVTGRIEVVTSDPRSIAIRLAKYNINRIPRNMIIRGRSHRITSVMDSVPIPSCVAAGCSGGETAGVSGPSTDSNPSTLE